MFSSIPDIVRQRYLSAIEQSYASISVKDFSGFVGAANTDQIAALPGMTVTPDGFVAVSPARAEASKAELASLGLAAGNKAEVDKLAQLTTFISFLEKQ